MKNIIKYLKFLPIIAAIVSCSSSDEKEFKEVKLVPAYTIEVSNPIAANNTLAGYTSVNVPSTINIYKETDLVIHYEQDARPLNFNVASLDESSAYIAAEDVNPAVEGMYKVSYTISSSDEVTNAETGTITLTETSTDYLLEIANTDVDGNALATVAGVGLTITNTTKITTVKDKETGEVSIPEAVTPATNTTGEITTVVTVDDVTEKTTTVVTTVASAISEVVVTETEIYN
ncbi:hypothetical protein [Wenyingzhuangia sp. IMCC45574]